MTLSYKSITSDHINLPHFHLIGSRIGARENSPNLLILDRVPKLCCPCPPYRAICPKYYFDCFGPSQMVCSCYKSCLKVLF